LIYIKVPTDPNVGFGSNREGLSSRKNGSVLATNADVEEGMG
jgi:hypothetical protein